MASELETLQAISQHGDLNPIQAGRLKQLQGAGSTGNPYGIESIGLPSTPSTTGYNADSTSAFDKTLASDKGDVTDFLTRYQKAVPDIINNTSAKYGLTDQAAGVNALNTRVKTLQGNTDNSGAGGYASGDQVDAAINSRYLPQYSTALSNFINSTGAAQTEEAQLTKPYETEGSMLNDRLAREMTGFTAEQERELGLLTTQLTNGVTLTKDQMDNANALAIAKQNYQAAVDSQKIQSQNQVLGQGQTYYNPITKTAYNPFATPAKP